MKHGRDARATWGILPMIHGRDAAPLVTWASCP